MSVFFTKKINMLFKKRIEFKPFEYQWAYDYWFKQQNAHWLHSEIPMQSDVIDWNINLSELEKNVIGNILKGFAQTETHVEDYWTGKVTKWIPIPEIKMMATCFGSVETIHAVAYSYLNDTLGLDDFSSFLEDEETMNKLDVLINLNDTEQETIEDIARSIAIFSACAEGIQLFSSFAILMSFRKSNRLKGIGQQMIYSVKDESLHSEAGCKLFRVIISENPHIWTEEFKNSIYLGVDIALENEFKYIDKVFELGNLETISIDQLKNFMRHRANRKLKELNLDEKYEVDEELYEEMKWFYHLISGEMQTDFFANRETGYSKPNEDWGNDELF